MGKGVQGERVTGLVGSLAVFHRRRPPSNQKPRTPLQRTSSVPRLPSTYVEAGASPFGDRGCSVAPGVLFFPIYDWMIKHACMRHCGPLVI